MFGRFRPNVCRCYTYIINRCVRKCAKVSSKHRLDIILLLSLCFKPNDCRYTGEKCVNAVNISLFVTKWEVKKIMVCFAQSW